MFHYQNEAVVAHFCSIYPQYTVHTAQEIFHDLLACLYLKNKRQQQNKKTYFFGPLLVLDDMWHCFILHTRDYMNFSLRYFGEYLHHDPEPPGAEHLLSEFELNDFLHDCMTHLGEDWIDRRFGSFFE